MSKPAIEPASAREGRRATLSRLEQGATAAEALAFFDSLPAVPIADMLGAWKGSGLPTGHPLDGTLELSGWHGKRFESAEAVHPLVMNGGGGRYNLNPAYVPMGRLRKHARTLKSSFVASLAKATMPFFATSKPAARLRMTEFRGVVSATMVYDALPVNDIFRKIDDDTVLGLMDLRGDAEPGWFFFVLRRE